MDRYFYIIEEENGKKYIHMSGNVYANGDGNYRLAEWTFFYTPTSEIYNVRDFLSDANSRVDYMGDITEEEAEEISNTYFNGEAVPKLQLEDITEDTPRGEYWCEY